MTMKLNTPLLPVIFSAACSAFLPLALQPAATASPVTTDSTGSNSTAGSSGTAGSASTPSTGVASTSTSATGTGTSSNTSAGGTTTVSNTSNATATGSNITTTSGQWTMVTALANSTTVDSLVFNTVLVTGQTQSTNTSGALIGLGDSMTGVPQYQLNIIYNGSQYNIFVSRNGSSGPQGNVSITQASNATLWNYLDNSWRSTPGGIPLTLQYQKVSGSSQTSIMILYLAGAPMWSWTDTSPIAGMSRVFVSSTNCTQIFQNPTISTINTQALLANTQRYFPLPTSSSVLITFQSAALPSTICCCLYASPLDNLPTYEVDLNVELNSSPAGSQLGSHIALIHHTPPNEAAMLAQGNLKALSSDIPTSRGLYDVLLPSNLNLSANQNYFLLYTPDANNNYIVFGIINSSGAQQPLMSWQNAAWKNNNTRGSNNVMTLCSLQSNVALSNVSIQGSIANAPVWSGSIGLKSNGSDHTAAGLQQAVAYTSGTTNWATPNLTFPQNDCGCVQFGLDLTLPNQYLTNSAILTSRGPLTTSGLTTSGNGAVILFGTAPQDLPLYGLCLDPLPASSSLNGTNAALPAANAQVSAFSLASGTAQPIGSPVILRGTTLSGNYQVVYQKTNTDDAAITLYAGSSTTPLATLPIPSASTGIKYITLSCEQAPVTYHNVSISMPTAAQTAQNNSSALNIFNAALNQQTTASTNNSTTNTSPSAPTSSTATSTPPVAPATTPTPSSSVATETSSSSTSGSTTETSESVSTPAPVNTASTTAPEPSTVTNTSSAAAPPTPIASVTTQLTQLPINGNAVDANGYPALAFNWGTTALNQAINSSTGFSMSCSFDLSGNVNAQGTINPSATLALGLAPAKVETTVQHQFDATIPVATGGTTTYKSVSLTGFAGASQLFLISIVPTPNKAGSNDITLTHFLPSINGANSQWVKQTVVSRAAPEGQVHTLWMSCAQTTSAQTVTIGIDSALDVSPIYTWNTGTTPFFAQTGISGWATTVLYKNIQLKPYGTVAPTYNWDLTKSSTNKTGTLDPDGGGYLTAEVTVNQLSSSNTATFMVGFTSDSTSTMAAQDNGNKIFTSAEYNVQIQATAPSNGQPYGPAYVSMRRPTSLITPAPPAGSDSPYDGSMGEPQLVIPAQPAPAFHSLAQPTSSGSASAPIYGTFKLWVRYTPATAASTGSSSGMTRTFDAGILSTSDSTSDINSLAPLWSWTETNVSPSRRSLQNVSISAWGNTATITKISLTPNPKGTKVTPLATSTSSSGTSNTNTVDSGAASGEAAAPSAGQIILNGVSTAANLPGAAQWDIATQINPGTQHKFTITGGDPNAYAVFAFSQNGTYTSSTAAATTTSAHPILFTFVVTPTGILLNAGGQLITSSPTGGLTSTATPYWIQADSNCIRIGGYSNDNNTPLVTPYIQYPGAATLAALQTQAAAAGATSTAASTPAFTPAFNLSDATSWFCAYQGFNNAILAYSGGQRLQNQLGTTNPAASILRSSMSRNAARIVSAQETMASSTLRQAGPSSNAQSLARYTLNAPTTSSSGPLYRWGR